MAVEKSNIFDYLISNRRFIDWVKNPNESSNYFWEKWLDENSDCAVEFNDARLFVKGLKFKDEKLNTKDLDELLGGIIKEEQAKILREDKAGIKFSSNFKWLIRIAAIFILGIMSFIPFYLGFKAQNKPDASAIVSWEIIENPSGKKSEIALPDGTKVTLNSESTLKYPKEFDDEVRMVQLNGEAFFDVRHMDDYPFIVKTGILETQVFGTTFNVNYFPFTDKLDISLVSGKVKVQNTQDKESVYLEPGEQLSYDKVSHKMMKRKFNIENTIGWLNGYIIFEDVDFKEFIERLEKWYGVNFQIYGSPPQNWKFNGRYQNEELENILIGIKFVYKLDYNMNGNNVIIKFK